MTGVPILQNSGLSTVRLAVEIAWGAALTDLTGASWVWTDVTTDVYLDPGVSITVGRPDESSQTNASEMTVKLDNTTGAYSLGGQSSNWPNVRRGTPVRVRVSLNSGSSWTVKYQGNAVGFTPNWDSTGKWATVTLLASGPLRQINQGTAGAVSYYAQMIPLLTGSGQLFEGLQYYWNNENGNGAEGPNGITTCAPTYPAGITTGPSVLTPNLAYLPQVQPPANTSGAFPISAPVPTAWDFSTTGTLPATTSTGKLQFMWFCAISSLPGTQTQPLLYWKTSSSGSVQWQLNWDYQGNIWPSNSSGWVGTAVAFGANSVAWYMCLQQTTVGSGCTINLTVSGLGSTPAGFSWTGATGSTCGYLTFVNWLGPNINSGNTPVIQAHMTVANVTNALSSYINFYQGAIGEVPTARLTRIANANGIPITIGTTAVTETSASALDVMGSQFYDTTANLLRECEATQLGVLYDGLGIGLQYFPRTARLSGQPSMTVDASSTPSAVVMPFAPVDDDQLVINDFTASRRNGGTGDYQDLTGTSGVNAVGDYQTSVTINPQSDLALGRYAQWMVHVGTVGGYRYPTFSFELEKVTSLLSSWLTCNPGDRVDITNIAPVVRSQHPIGTIKNVLEGWHETIDQFRWHVDANCTNWQAWNAVTLAAPTGSTLDTVGRYESDGSTVTTTVSAGATSISVTTPSGPKWTTSSVTADDFPLTVNINGNAITVTAISSTTSPQTFTVNAIPYGITSGSAVTVWQNPVLGV